MKPPTDKQKEFAREIGRMLEISLPEPQTRQSLFLFIREYRPAFDTAMAESCRIGNYGHEGEYYDGQADATDAFDEMVCMGLDPYTGGFAD